MPIDRSKITSDILKKAAQCETADELIMVINQNKDKIGNLADELLFDIERAGR